MRSVTGDGRSIALTKCGRSLGALENHCPHQGGPLGEGSIEKGLLPCPWHGYDYDPLTDPPAGQTAQIRVRAAVVLLVAFVVLAERFGRESILGAFMAGAVVGLVDKNSQSHPNFRVKLEAIGYGFLIPVFFVTSGFRLVLSSR